MSDIKHDRYFLEIQDEADLQASLLSQSEIQLFSKALDFHPPPPRNDSINGNKMEVCQMACFKFT